MLRRPHGLAGGSDATDGLDVLVVSHACVTAINRAPYRRLAELGWSLEIATADALRAQDISRTADPPRPGDPPVHYLRVRGTNYRVWRFEGLGALLNARRPRILLLEYDPGSRLAIEAGRWARAHGARVACLTYDNIERHVLTELRRSPAAAARTALVRLLSAAARPLVDHVFVLSADGAAVMRGLGFGDRLSQIPLGFEPSLFRPDPAARARVRRELGLRDVTFAYFGRLIPEKGVHLLVEALHRMRDRPWQLLLDRFGDYTHPYIQHVRQLIDRLGLADRVVHFDASHEQMGDYMNAADVVVMPSVTTDRFKEQYGRVAPEAMACGRLVVVSDCGALPELVGDAGIVVPQRELGALDRRLAPLVTDAELRATLGRRAAARARGQLSLPVQCERMHRQFLRWSTPSRRPAALGAAAEQP